MDRARNCRDIETQFALGETNLLDAEASLQLATRIDQEAIEAFNAQAPPLAEVLTLNKRRTLARMIELRNSLKA